MDFQIGQNFTTTYPPEAAAWCNSNNAYIEKTEQGYEIKGVPAPAEEELAERKLNMAKQERADSVSKIVVTVGNMEFDGDEISQERMSRTITAAKAMNKTDDDTTTWVLHDNTIAQVTVAQLAEALYLAGLEQTKLWVLPYTNDSSEESTEETV